MSEPQAAGGPALHVRVESDSSERRARRRRELFLLALTVPLLREPTVLADGRDASGPQAALPATEPSRPCIAHDHCHDGFYAGATTALGYSALLPTRPLNLSQGGGWGTSAVTVRVGGALVPGLVAGGSLGGSLSGEFSSAHAGAFLDWYPRPQQGLHGVLGIEAWRLVAPSPASASDSISALTAGGTLAVGYDAWFRPRWSIGVLVTLEALPPAIFTDASSDRYQFTPFQLTLGLNASWQ